jgi:uncharacterized repeat protein (TIGR02543 family)
MNSWRNRYSVAATDNTYSFAFNHFLHMGSNQMRYFWDTSSFSGLTSAERTKIQNALTEGFNMWGGSVSGISATSATAHVKVWYDNSILNDPNWGSAPRNGGDVNNHYRQGPQSSNGGRHDAEIRITQRGKDATQTKLNSVMAHEIGHHYAIADLVGTHSPHADLRFSSIYGDRQLDTWRTPTRHDANAIRIGLDNRWFDNRTSSNAARWTPAIDSNWRRLRSDPTARGQFITNTWEGNNYFNSSGDWVSAHRVRYNLNGESGTAPAMQTKISDGPNIQISDVVPTGREIRITYNTHVSGYTLPEKRVSYTFVNWNTNADGSGTPYAHGTTYSASQTSDVTLFAQWNKRIGVLPLPVRPGYVFYGWRTAANGGGTLVTDSTVITSNMTLHAHWGVYGIVHIQNASNLHLLHSTGSINNINPLPLRHFVDEPNYKNNARYRWVLQFRGRHSNVDTYEIRNEIPLATPNNFGFITNNNQNAILTGGAPRNTAPGNVTIVRNTSNNTVEFRLINTNLVLATNLNGTQAIWRESNTHPDRVLEQSWHLEVHSSTYNRGAVIGNNRIDISDSTEIKRFVNRQSSEVEKSAVQFYWADVLNKDGSVGLNDAIQIDRHIGRQVTPLDCPSFALRRRLW